MTEGWELESESQPADWQKVRGGGAWRSGRKRIKERQGGTRASIWVMDFIAMATSRYGVLAKRNFGPRSQDNFFWGRDDYPGRITVSVAALSARRPFHWMTNWLTKRLWVMRVMSATLKEIRHQKQRGAASEAWREREEAWEQLRNRLLVQKMALLLEWEQARKTNETFFHTRSSAVWLFISLTL